MKLRRKFKFKNFKQALDFRNRVGELAEDHSHHPAILTGWGKTTITCGAVKWVVCIKNHFILAAKKDRA
jgi:4a-hydroxytetrahydrobiopterin dehydratase